jgi:hypothetical protein
MTIRMTDMVVIMMIVISKPRHAPLTVQVAVVGHGLPLIQRIPRGNVVEVLPRHVSVTSVRSQHIHQYPKAVGVHPWRLLTIHPRSLPEGTHRSHKPHNIGGQTDLSYKDKDRLSPIH